MTTEKLHKWNCVADISRLWKQQPRYRPFTESSFVIWVVVEGSNCKLFVNTIVALGNGNTIESSTCFTSSAYTSTLYRSGYCVTSSTNIPLQRSTTSRRMSIPILARTLVERTNRATTFPTPEPISISTLPVWITSMCGIAATSAETPNSPMFKWDATGG